MSFKVIKGAYRLESLPITASTALTKDTLLEWTSGYLAAADDNDTDVAGILAETIASTDSDYATTGKLKRVIVPTERHILVEADTADTFVQATHGGVECGIVDSANVDLDDSSNDVFRPIKPGSTSLKVIGYLKVNGAY
jgi:hypothetical protein